MNISFKKKGEGYEVEFEDVSKTFINFIKEFLKNVNGVEEVASIKVHPHFDNPKLWIKTKGDKKPKEAIKEAIDLAKSFLEELESKFKESLS